MKTSKSPEMVCLVFSVSGGSFLLAEGWCMLGASSCAFFIHHNGLFLPCILLICLSTEIYYLLDFCNSFAPKSTVWYVENSRATAKKTRTEAQCRKGEGLKPHTRKEWPEIVTALRKPAARPGSRKVLCYSGHSPALIYTHACLTGWQKKII